ncbi:MAG: polysaccharide export protein [Bacteroidetes bacterium]|jgi:polysaccharide export outer membrane protein|nr:polysaccharide export protein [Bacteroidota bacterium]
MKKYVKPFMQKTGLSIMMVLLMFSCVSQKNVKILQEKANKELTTQFENQKKITYRLQVGDQLYIKIYSVDPKTAKFFQTDFPSLMNPTYLYLNSYKVDEFGYINFSFVDKMYVKGLSIIECKDLIQKTLNEYFKDATVHVKLVNYQVSVLGEVNSPGTFTVDDESIDLFQALGRAGGTTDFGNLKQVKIVRQVPEGSQIHLIDLTDNRVLQSDYFYLMPNDIVYIEPRAGKAFVQTNFPYGLILSVIGSAAIFLNLFDVQF